MENPELGYATPLEIKYISKPEFDHPDMIAAWPGMGYIAKISADYLRRRLNAKLFAEVTYFHNMLITKGRANSPPSGTSSTPRRARTS